MNNYQLLLLRGGCLLVLIGLACGRPKISEPPAEESEVSPKSQAPRSVLQNPKVLRDQGGSQELPAAEPIAEQAASRAAPAPDLEPAPPSSAVSKPVRVKAKKPRRDTVGKRGRSRRKSKKVNREESNDALRGSILPRELRLLKQRLTVEQSKSKSNCDSATERSQAICDLAKQICQLIERDPNVASLASHCSQARERCRQAKLTTSSRCD